MTHATFCKRLPILYLHHFFVLVYDVPLRQSESVYIQAAWSFACAACLRLCVVMVCCVITKAKAAWPCLVLKHVGNGLLRVFLCLHPTQCSTPQHQLCSFFVPLRPPCQCLVPCIMMMVGRVGAERAEQAVIVTQGDYGWLSTAAAWWS